MPGYSSAIATIAIAKQTAKGAAAANPTVKWPLAGAPSLAVDKRRGRYSITDIGRDQGNAFTAGMSVGGDFQTYLHFDGFRLLAYLALGANADTGAGPNYTHTATPADSLPYFTLWRMIGNVIFEKWVDCKCTSLRVESAAGSPAMVNFGVVGISSTFEAADTALARLTSDGLLHMEAVGAFKFATVAQPLASSVFEIQNNVSGYQADDYIFNDVDEGKRIVTYSFSTRFRGPTSFPKYREFYYGSDAGTAMSAVVGTQAFQVLYARNANSSVQIDLPEITFAAVPVQADPGGDPIETTVACEVNKPAASPIVTVTTKDQSATV